MSNYTSTPPPINPLEPPKKPKNKTLIILLIVFLTVVGLLIICVIVGMLVYGRTPITSAQDTLAITAESIIVNTAKAQLPSKTDFPEVVPTESITNTPPSSQASRGQDVNMSAQEFISYYNNLTDLQKEDFLISLKGKNVTDWTGTVYEVDTDGTIKAVMPDSLINTVYLSGVPLDTAKTVNKDDIIKYSGTITKVDEFIGLSIYIDVSAFSK